MNINEDNSNFSNKKRISNSDSIRVLCRFRPPKKSEIELYGQSDSVDNFLINENYGCVEVKSESGEKKSFTFDKVI